MTPSDEFLSSTAGTIGVQRTDRRFRLVSSVASLTVGDSF